MKMCVYTAPEIHVQEIVYDCPVLNDSTDYHYGGGFGDDDGDD